MHPAGLGPSPWSPPFRPVGLGPSPWGPLFRPVGLGPSAWSPAARLDACAPRVVPRLGARRPQGGPWGPKVVLVSREVSSEAPTGHAAAWRLSPPGRTLGAQGRLGLEGGPWGARRPGPRPPPPGSCRGSAPVAPRVMPGLGACRPQGHAGARRLSPPLVCVAPVQGRLVPWARGRCLVYWTRGRSRFWLEKCQCSCPRSKGVTARVHGTRGRLRCLLDKGSLPLSTG